MGKKKQSDKKQNKLNDPQAAYSKGSIHVFNSFEDEARHTATQRASLTYKQRMMQIEQLRKLVFNKYLLSNGKWPSISKTFQIMPPLH